MRLFQGRGANREPAVLRRSTVRMLVGSLALGLVLFHLRLLWLRLSDQSVLEPVVAAKWLVTLVLLSALWRLRVRGYRLLAGRPAGVIWLLALLLHIQAPVVPSTDLAGPVDLGLLFAMPVTVTVGAAVALTLGLLLAALRSTASPQADPRLRLGSPGRGGPLDRSLPALACRPPPALA